MLRRKMWRDLKENYGAYLALITVLIIGMMMYVSLALTLENLNQSLEDYYQKYDFAHGFAHFIRGPKNLVMDLKSIEGIEKASGRIVQDVLVDTPSTGDITTLRLISINGEKESLNKIKLEEGRMPVEGEKELLVSPGFLQGNNYQVGDSIPLIIGGNEVKFVISGTANSPEYVYEIPNGQTLAPNPKTFGVAYLSYDTIAPLLNMESQINDVAFTMESGVLYLEIKEKVNNLIEDYGGQSYPRKEQLSHAMLAQEIAGLEASAIATPAIFLLVAASILYITLKRTVEQQRGQIGILKAFGFSTWEITSHYLGYALFIGVLGGLGGGIFGTGLSFSFAKMYQLYFNIPDLSGRFSLSYLLVGILVSCVFCLIAGFQGVRSVLSLNAAEAMRPSAPQIGKRTIVERVSVLWDFLSTGSKMAVRNLFRSKQRAILTLFGIAAAFSMMVASKALFDASYYLTSFQFDQVERYDLKVIFHQYKDKTEALSSSKNLSGVINAEPLLEIPVTLSNKWYEKNTLITGLQSKSSLYHLLTKKGEPVSLPENGLIVSSQLAKILDIVPGDKVTIKPLLGDKKERHIIVREVIPQYVGLGAYMEIDVLSELLQEPPVASSILLQIDKEKLSQVRKDLRGAKNVSAIQDKTKLKAQFEELMASSKASQYILLFFAFITGFAIVYNVNVIALSERERELATLMVIGMTEKEISHILFWEQSVLGVLGILIGIPMSYGMLYGISLSAANEIYNMPLIIKPESYLLGLVGTWTFLLTAQRKMRSKIDKLSMLDVLKEQD